MRHTPRIPHIIRNLDGPDPVVSAELKWIERSDDSATLRIDRLAYSDEAIFRTCYVFTDRCFLFIDCDGPDHFTVRLRRRQIDADLVLVAGEFGNELINQRVRIGLAKETEDIRRLIVAQ